MKRTTLLISIVLALLVGSSAVAQTSSYDLSWNTIDAGGGLSSGGSYALVGTLGQPDAAVLSGGSYTLNGGFWNAALVTRSVYLPTILR